MTIEEMLGKAAVPPYEVSSYSNTRAGAYVAQPLWVLAALFALYLKTRFGCELPRAVVPEEKEEDV